MLERGLDLCQVFNLLLWFPETAAALGCAYTFAGRVTEALPLLEEAEQRDAAMGTTGGHALRVWLCERGLSAGRPHAGGDPTGWTCPRLARTHKERGHEAWAPAAPGEIAAHQAPQKSSRPHITTGRPSPWPTNSACALAHCCLGLGTLYARTGQRQQARAELSAAIEMYCAMDMIRWLLQAETALAQVEER